MSVSDDSDAGYLLIWPPNYTWNLEHDTIQILDGTGQVIARVGDKVQIGGGEVPSWPKQVIPVNCSAPYWIVGEWGKTIEAGEETQ